MNRTRSAAARSAASQCRMRNKGRPMVIFYKIAGTIVSWMVITLVCAAGTELYFGESRPAMTTIFTNLLWIPSLYFIWRKRPPKA